MPATAAPGGHDWAFNWLACRAFRLAIESMGYVPAATLDLFQSYADVVHEEWFKAIHVVTLVSSSAVSSGSVIAMATLKAEFRVADCSGPLAVRRFPSGSYRFHESAWVDLQISGGQARGRTPGGIGPKGENRGGCNQLAGLLKLAVAPLKWAAVKSMDPPVKCVL